METNERAPLLSDAEIGRMSVTENGFVGENKYRMARRVRNFYEAKITSGELMVAKTVKRSELNEHYRTEHNIMFAAAGLNWNTHCAGCGAKIVEG